MLAGFVFLLRCWLSVLSEVQLSESEFGYLLAVWHWTVYSPYALISWSIKLGNTNIHSYDIFQN